MSTHGGLNDFLGDGAMQMVFTIIDEQMRSEVIYIEIGRQLNLWKSTNERENVILEDRRAEVMGRKIRGGKKGVYPLVVQKTRGSNGHLKEWRESVRGLERDGVVIRVCRESRREVRNSHVCVFSFQDGCQRWMWMKIWHHSTRHGTLSVNGVLLLCDPAGLEIIAITYRSVCVLWLICSLEEGSEMRTL